MATCVLRYHPRALTITWEVNGLVSVMEGLEMLLG